jgi:hypothetical protein
MRTRSVWLILAALCAALALTACGDDDGDDLSAESRAAIDDIEEICDGWKKSLEARGEFPVDGFDPDDPKADELRKVGAYFVSGQPIAAQAMADLRAVPVPAEIKSDVDSLLAALDAEVAWAKVQTTAAAAGDIPAFKATLKDAASTNQTVEDAADQLGAECSF